MSRRLAAAFASLLLLAAPLAVHAQAYGQHGHERGGGGYGGRAGGERGGYEGGGPRGGYGGGAPYGNGGYAGGGRGYGGPPQSEDPRYRGPAPYSARGPNRPPAYGQMARGWARGQYIPPEARGEMVGDFARYHLRRPPRGYYWYRTGDDFILASVATGVIFEVIPAAGGY